MALKATVSNQAEGLKRLYPKGVEKVIYKASRLFERCRKGTGFTNEDKALVVRISGTSGVSPDFATAIATQGASRRARFIINRKKEYGVYSVDGEAIAATNGDPKAIVNVLKNEMTETMYKWSRAMARNVCGKAGGAVGVVSSSTTTSSTTLIFASTADMQWLEVGDWIEFSDLDGTSASADRATDIRGGDGTRLQVQTINRQANSCTLNATLDSIGAATGDYVFNAGAYSRAMTGLQGWLPDANPSSAAFFGVDRTSYDLVRVSGYRYTAGGGGSYGTAIINASAQAETHGVNDLTSLYMSAIDFGYFVEEVGAQRLRDGNDSAIGYKYIEVHCGMARGGTLRVISEPCLPVGRAWAIKDEHLFLETAGPAPSMLDHAGLGGKGLLMPQNDDAVQGRLGCYGNVTYENPGEGVIIQLAAS